MIDLYTETKEITVINERPISKILRKQDSITMLFPTFDDRVRAVGSYGGISLDSEEPGIWRFKATSVTQQPGKKIYDVVMEFSNIADMIKKHGRDMRLWKSDKSGVNLRKLAAEIYDETDLKIYCNCPAAKYWGFDYIQTKYKDRHDGPETRRPKVRNPKGYGEACKHVQAVLDALPWYKSSLAGHIKRLFMEDVKEVEDSTKKEQDMIKKSAEELKKKAENKPQSFARGGKPVETEKEAPEGKNQRKRKAN